MSTEELQPEDWEEEYIIGTCDSCEEPNKRVILSRDPYIAEVYPEDDPEASFWCYKCYSDRHDEV